MTDLRLGFSTGVFYPKTNLTNALRKLLELQNKVVEINIATPEEFSLITQEDLELINKFEIKTVHAPFKNILYNSETSEVISDLLTFAKKIQPEYILFHPDTVEDFSSIYNVLGSLAAFENMDVRKTFGNKSEDLAKIFELCPEAGWVCDLNHIYTIDRSMQLSRKFHQEFGHKLFGYHISGYKDEQTLHTCFYQTHEFAILDAIENFDVPLIHEGGYTQDPDFLRKEWDFVQNYLKG